MRSHLRIPSLALCALLLATPAFGHGTVGRRTFVEPFFMEDASPKDELVLARPHATDSDQGGRLSLGMSLEKRLLADLSLTVESAWVHDEPEDARSNGGFDNVGFQLKYAVRRDRPHEFILSFAAEVEAPTGERAIGAAADPSVRPMLAFAKGFGDLPDEMWRWQPLAVMGDAGFSTTINDGGPGDVFFYDVLLMYSTPYLESFVWDPRLPPGLRDLVPVVEFNFQSTVNGDSRPTRAAVTPGIMYVGRSLQFGIGGQLPMNDTTRRDLDWGIVGMVDLFLDDALPDLFATPPF